LKTNWFVFQRYFIEPKTVEFEAFFASYPKPKSFRAFYTGLHGLDGLQKMKLKQ